jgi:DHA3 family tetracycline resistance protein-like MFS transporter
MLVLALFLASTMTEHGFTPVRREDRQTFQAMLETVRSARRLLGRQPLLLVLLSIGLFFGLYSEGYDRLWTAHLLENFSVPWLAQVQPVVWFSAVKMAEAALSLAGTEVVRRRVDLGHAGHIGRVLAIVAGAIVLAMMGFGLTHQFGLAVALFLLIGVLRSVHTPLHGTWFNQRIDDPHVRATIFSAQSQVDAVGQILGGPAVGAIGNVSIRAALVVSAAILSPAVALYGMAVRRTRLARNPRVPG